MPAASSWGEEGFWRVWLNESNEWIYPHLRIAQTRMTELAERFVGATGVTERALASSRARIASGSIQRLAVHSPHRHQP
jgi:predicted glycosyl hydrolase (DUF1957 family)